MLVEFVSPYVHNPNSGIGRYVHTLAEHLSESVDVTICRLRNVPLANRFSPLRQLPIGIEGHVPGSIVHFPQIMGCAMMLYRPYHPSVATVHDLGFLELPEEWEMFDPIARRLLRLSLAGLKRVDMIVAVSEFTRQGVIKHLGIPEDRVVTIHSGIDHDLFRPVPSAREILISCYPHLAAIALAPWLLYVGSELPRKNITTLLRAVALVREEIPDIRLIKVGAAGGERFRRDTLRVIDELGLREHILFFEDIAEDKLPLFYSAADVFVTASKLEGFGFPVLEAMACGTPTIVPSTALFVETVENSSQQFDVENPSDLTRAIVSLLADNALQDHLREKGLKNASRYLWSTSARQLLACYQQLTPRGWPVDEAFNDHKSIKPGTDSRSL